MNGKYDLIITVVDRGFADDVMTAAKKTGAGGGTVINARGSGAREAQKFFGTIIQPQKQLVLILTPRSRRDAIMKSICEETGLSKEGRGICFSLPADSVRGVSGLTDELPDESGE